jgi:hypothetical protein
LHQARSRKISAIVLDTTFRCSITSPLGQTSFASIFFAFIFRRSSHSFAALSRITEAVVSSSMRVRRRKKLPLVAFGRLSALYQSTPARISQSSLKKRPTR